MSACTRLATRLLETQLVLSCFAHSSASHTEQTQLSSLLLLLLIPAHKLVCLCMCLSCRQGG